ncbi:c-type cytochrome [Caulobacter mirabilis]|uniref:Cytochrome c family protein n=1 Tax=Caulobacter mirabilis TaxID=69666 RepID=A0A2D2B280_9CAUL|nr:cytochrome c family protein [Caulobacter mirabilis]ATQ44361.1 cytochrome c family protein [Caulobacter mirabilis]
MSDLTFNKIAAGLLATGLVIFGLRELTTIAFDKHPPEKPGYAVAVAEEAGEGGATAEVPPDWGSVLLLPANIAQGQAVSAKCASCHTFTQGGANGTGPNLYGTLGKKPGTHAGFAYSPAMAAEGNAHPIWDYDELDAFLKAPQKHLPGTKMTFVGLKKQEERIAMIAYLHSLGSTLPVPAPRPAAAPAAEGAAAPAEGAAAPAAGAPAAGAAPAAAAPAAAPAAK